MKYQKVTANVSAEIKIMYQVHKIRGQKLLEKFPGISKANIYKHARRPIGTDFVDKRKTNSGRPSKITAEFKRRYVSFLFFGYYELITHFSAL